jgi:hypothetical protein
MKIKIKKKINEFDKVFPDLNSFKDYVLGLGNNIRFDNDVIKKEIEDLMLKLKNQDGVISYSSIGGWLNKNYTFKSKKWGDLEYWLERGWSKENALKELKKRNHEIKQRNRLCVEYWINKGYSEEEGFKIISESQSKSSKCVINHPGKSKKMLREKGYTEEEITELCLTPTNVRFWIKKGYSEEEAVEYIRKHQSNASKHVNYDERLAPNNVEYWINKGFTEEESKQKVSERQRTFSLEICIQKYGEEEGKKRFTERQNKWLTSLTQNGNMVIGYSKISQELFYSILEHYEINDRENIHFATHNKEFKLLKKDGGVWLYDFTDIKNKKIIEFHGDLYHGNPKKFTSTDCPHPFRKDITAQEIWDKDELKINIAEENGYEVLIIWDSEYRWGNKQEVINRCITFLNQK